MSLDTVLKRARKRQAEQFTDRANVGRPIGEMVFNPVTGQTTQPVEIRYTSIPCKVKTTSQVGFDVAAGQTDIRLNTREVEFPLEMFGVATSFAEDDVVEIVASTYNAVGVGEKFRVTDIDRRTWQACRRTAVEETSVPISWEV